MQNEKTYFFIFIAEQHPSLFKISKRSTISQHNSLVGYYQLQCIGNSLRSLLS